MGFVFAAVFVELWETGKIRYNLRNALILGLASGMLGLLIWKGTFKIHPLPPLLHYTDFYIQRIPAHVVYAVFATLTYRMIRESSPHAEGQSQMITMVNLNRNGKYKIVYQLSVLSSRRRSFFWCLSI